MNKLPSFYKYLRILLSVILVSVLSLLFAFPRFIEAQSPPAYITLTINSFEHTGGIHIGNREFYVKVKIDGVERQSRQHSTGCEVRCISFPDGWVFTQEVSSAATSVDIEVRLLEADSFLAGSDDEWDISPTDSKRTRIRLNPLTSTPSWTVDGHSEMSPPFSDGSGARINFDINVELPDLDGDGLPDIWETNGLDTDGDGTIDVDLPAFGADPEHKDLFLELDWVLGDTPTRYGIQQMKQAFKAAPITAGSTASSLCNPECGIDAPPNPDDLPGINLWVDTGALTVDQAGEDGTGSASCSDAVDNDGNGLVDAADPSCGGEGINGVQGLSCSNGLDDNGDGLFDAADPLCLVGDNLGGGNQLTLRAPICNVDNNFNNAKQTNFAIVRTLAFRYGISAPLQTPACPRSGGWGEIGGNDFIEYLHDGGTIMHEFGHTLNLGHGGNENANCKPNYVSVMNYDLQLGIPQFGGNNIIFDFSPPRYVGGRSTAPLVSISENNLDESLIFDAADPTNWFVYKNLAGSRIQSPLNGDLDSDGIGDGDGDGVGDGVDWNGDNDTADSGLAVNVDNSSTSGAPSACNNSSTNSVLTGYDDWSNISLPFRHFGSSADGVFDPIDEPELTLEELRKIHQEINTTDLRITKSDSSDPVVAGEVFTYTVQVTNGGPNPAWDVQVTDVLPDGLQYIDSSAACVESPQGQLVCDIGTTFIAEVKTVEISVLPAVDLALNDGGTTIIENVASVENLNGPDSDSSDNEAIEQTTIIAVSDLSITASPPAQQVVAGQRFQYTLEVTNNGPSYAGKTQIVDTLSPNVTFLDSDSNCSEESNRVLICDIGVMAPGDSNQVTITGLAHALLSNDEKNILVVGNTAVVTSAEAEDPNLANNSIETQIEIFSTRIGSGTVVFYSLEEQQGDTIYDLSGENEPVNLGIEASKNISWTEGGLAVNVATTIESDATPTKLIDAAQTTNELTVEAWIAPENLVQEGPSRIVTFSNEKGQSNFVVGQGRWHNQPSQLYDVRLRTTHTSDDGRPSTLTPNGVLNTELTHVVYTRRADGSVAKLYINGEEKAQRTVGGDFSNWATDYRLALASEIGGDYSWLGEYQLVAIFNRALSDDEVLQNFQAGPNGDQLITGRPISEDLFGFDYELWTDPATPRAEANIDVGIVVHQISGKKLLNDVVVRFYSGDPDKDGTVIGEAEVDWLSPRHSAISSSINWIAPAAGVFDIFAVIDPDNAIEEKDESNNVIRRKITVLEPEEDELAPHVDRFTVNNSDESTVNSTVELVVSASDPEPGAVEKIAFVEYDFENDVGEWIPVQASEWLTYTDDSTAANWTLQPTSGLKYMQAWARDNAGNISLYPYQQYINYLPISETLPQDEGTFYRYELTQGQYLSARVEPISGDPDLYIWAEDYMEGRPAWVSNLSQGADKISIEAPVDGIYQVEVYGYTDTEYRLIVEVLDSAPELVAAASSVGLVDLAKPIRPLPLVLFDNMVSPLNNPFEVSGNDQAIDEPELETEGGKYRLYLPTVQH